MNENIVLKSVLKLLLPVVILFAFYIQVGGETSPGGGFQSGVILASGLIAYSFAYGIEKLQKIVKPQLVRVASVCGVAVYAITGVAAVMMDGHFLDYSAFMVDKIVAQKSGVMIVEAGVGITVFAVIMSIFYSFALRVEDA